MARVSSASTEADFLPAMVPFDWESAPGRPARLSTKKSACDVDVVAERDIEIPSLQLPPGQRPKDGFYLPYSRPIECSKLQNEEQVKERSIVSRARAWFSLKVPDWNSKKFLTGRKGSPFERSFKPPWIRKEEVHSCASIFNPLTGNKIVSRITRRMILEFQKKQSSLRRCLPSKLGSENQKKGHPSHNDPNRGRRLDSVDEDFATVADSPTPERSLQSSPSHDNRHIRNSSVETSKLSQFVENSRFMATMLLSLCPEADKVHAAGIHEISNDCSDEIRLSRYNSRRELSTSSKSIITSPPPVHNVPEIVTEQTSETPIFRENFTRSALITAKSHLQTLPVSDQNKRSGSLQKWLGKAGQSFENSRSGKLAPPRRCLSEDYADSYKKNNVADKKSIADEHSLCFKASPGKKGTRTRRPCDSSFSWKSCETHCQLQQESFTTLVGSYEQKSGNCDFVKEIFEDAREECERRGSHSSLVRNFSTGSSSSSSLEHDVVTRRSVSLSTPTDTYEVTPIVASELGNDTSSIDHLSPSWSSYADLNFPFITRGCNKPRSFTRCQSNAGQSHARDHSLEEEPEWEKPHATVPVSNHMNQLQRQDLERRSGSGRIKMRENRMPISMNVWKESLISSPLWPALSKARAASSDDDTDESYWLSESTSTDSSEYETPKAISHSPSVSSPARCNFPSPRPATWIVSKRLLKSSQLHQSGLLQRQSHSESPPTASVVTCHGSPTGRKTGLQQEIATSHSFNCRTNVSGVTFATREYPTESVYSEGPDLAPASRFARTSTVMSKVAQWEAEAGVGSSSKSSPIFLSRRNIAKSSPIASTPVAK